VVSKSTTNFSGLGVSVSTSYREMRGTSRLRVSESEPLSRVVGPGVPKSAIRSCYMLPFPFVFMSKSPKKSCTELLYYLPYTLSVEMLR